ncbi:serine/threonine protein kinase [Hyalangium versicolor]|uniref:serine/threonine protein kinase n=1 Tax=Hyalangium versicolor TaxID=2861190 RepID=UPI001CC9C13B|nr:serine/threonine protein kinase [Hyalangium versicolor]
MTQQAFHPDHLKPGDNVGPWLIVQSLGSGSFGHAFKAELDGEFFTLKIAVRPAPELSEDTPEKAREEGQVDGRMRHEGAVLLANATQQGLPQLRAVGRWPHPKKGYLYIVTDHVPGQPFHDWRERTRPPLAQLVDIFIAVVRVLAGLHGRGIFIRDFKSEHVIVPEDHRPVLVDLGSAWLPGGSFLTVGLAPGTPHALPPECIAFLREGSRKEGTRFNAAEAGDLYQVGVFMFEALTNCWPFDPRMTQEELFTAIQNIVPRAPHWLNPNVPESLSRITLRLLEKHPEDRYESAEVLLQALWDANKERASKAWKAPLEFPPGAPAPATQDELEERRLHQQETERRAQEARKQKAEELSLREQLEQFSSAVQQMETELRDLDEKAALRTERWRRIGLGLGLLLLSLGLFAAGWEWFAPGSTSSAFEKGRSLVSTLRNSWPVRTAAAWLCTTFGVGCAAPQLRPIPEDCPPEALRSMEEMNFFKTEYGNYLGRVDADIDINQPFVAGGHETGTYHEGKIVGRVRPSFNPNKAVPAGTLLYGHLWTEGLTIDGRDAIYGRYTEVLLPDGRRFPVCYVMGTDGYITKEPNSKPGAAILERTLPIQPVRRWP